MSSRESDHKTSAEDITCNIGCTLPSCFPQQCEDKWGHLCALADFSLALTESIQEINKHSFNNFELRIGELQGEVVASLGQVPLFYQPLPCPGHQSRKDFFFLQNAWGSVWPWQGQAQSHLRPFWISSTKMLAARQEDPDLCRSAKQTLGRPLLQHICLAPLPPMWRHAWLGLAANGPRIT